MRQLFNDEENVGSGSILGRRFDPAVPEGGEEEGGIQEVLHVLPIRKEHSVFHKLQPAEGDQAADVQRYHAEQAAVLLAHLHPDQEPAAAPGPDPPGAELQQA